jgi:hypothetical protein
LVSMKTLTAGPAFLGRRHTAPSPRHRR